MYLYIHDLEATAHKPFEHTPRAHNDHDAKTPIIIIKVSTSSLVVLLSMVAITLGDEKWSPALWLF